MQTSHAPKRPRTDADAAGGVAGAADVRDAAEEPLFILQVMPRNTAPVITCILNSSLQVIDSNEPSEVSVNNYIKMPYKAGHTKHAKKYDEECFAAFARHMLRRCQLDKSVHGKAGDFMLADVDEEGTEGDAVTVTDPDFELADGSEDTSMEELAEMLGKKGLDDDVEVFLKTMWQDMLNKAVDDKLAKVNFGYARITYGHLPWVQAFWSVH